ncbi:3-oxoadipate enol-lactonase [Arvimicrobium flavum]|uniref:3-oxoadipate enol-lactonase n=1 Tax=Arvimicrobium flavum TaxID=3393320 RepID=UPI00237A1683|nr:3-oxoadipate enol-lactonase [Mesorhizobium shangrilense]
MKFARVNGVVLHYELTDRSDLPVLVFSNSLGTDLRIWDMVAERLADRYRILRYDKRGHGLSEITPAPYNLIDHVEDLTALLAHLSISRVAVVGLSVGGLIAQGIAARHPDLVAALVLSNTAHKIGTEDSWNERIKTVSEKGIAAIADGVLERWFSPAYRSPDNADFAGYAAMLRRSPVEGYLGTCAAIRDADLTESTRALAVPVLCIAGEHDGATPPDLVRSTAALVKGAEFRIIADAGHIPCVEQPDAVASLVAGFLKGARYA